MFNKFYEYVKNAYKSTVYTRADSNGAIFYYSYTDFPGLKKREYSFRSSLGHILMGGIYYRDGYKKGRTVIFEHGMGSGHTGYMQEINRLTENGYLVFAYDHTGCMESGGENTGGFCQSLVDLDDALCALKKDEEFKDSDFSVIGHSWGGFSALNIAAFHPDVTHIVAISGYISVPVIISQHLGGILKKAGAQICEEEKIKNPRCFDVCAIDTLKNTKANVLVIHSKDDPVVSYEKNFMAMKKALEYNDNISFLSVDGKRHNPNYTKDAVRYKDAFFAEYNAAMKKNRLTGDIEKKRFKESFDWARMTAQDDSIWSSILMSLEK